jgi:hypothetical protein
MKGKSKPNVPSTISNSTTTNSNVSKPITTTNTINNVEIERVISPKRKANSDLVKKRKQLLDEENTKNRAINHQHQKDYIKDKLKKENRNSYYGWEDKVSNPSKPYIDDDFYSISNKPRYASYKNDKYKDSIIESKKQTGAAIKQIARNLRKRNAYLSSSIKLVTFKR